MEAQKSLRNSPVILPPLTADRVYDHNGAVPSTVRHAGRPQERPAAEVSASLIKKIKKRPNPALADLAVLAGLWLLLRSRKSVLVRLTRPHAVTFSKAGSPHRTLLFTLSKRLFVRTFTWSRCPKQDMYVFLQSRAKPCMYV